jgi:tetratricopeptide (TPR) repeat protein
VRKLAFTAAAVLACAAPAAAQIPRVHDVPRRPVLWAEADTNSAGVYFNHGVSRLTTRPVEAAAAFYWAARLRPGWAEPLYGRRVALLMSDPERLVRYMRDDRTTIRSPEIQAIDSLQLQALSLNPFLIQQFDKPLLRAYMTRAVTNDMQRSGGDANSALASHLVENWLHSTDPSMRAWVAYSEGRFPQARDEYERSLRRAQPRERPRIHTDLGRIHFFNGDMPKAVEHFTAASAELEKREKRDLVLVYESKALMEYSLGTVYEKMGNTAAAQEAYGRALQEDLAFGPAHRALSALALARGDTATTLSEMALAVELSPRDAALRLDYGLLLLLARKPAEGVAEIQKAAELEPLFATPQLILAKLYDSSSLPVEALEHYRVYLARAARDDPGHTAALARAAALEAELKGAP